MVLNSHARGTSSRAFGILMALKSLCRAAGSSLDGGGTGAGPSGCLACRRVKVPNVSGAWPNDVKFWQALENKPSLAKAIAELRMQ